MVVLKQSFYCIVLGQHFSDCVWVGIYLCGRAPDLWPEGRGLTPGRSGRRFFFSRVNCLCWLFISISVPTPFYCRSIKDSSHSAQGASVYTHTPLTQQNQSGLTMLFRHSVGTHQGSEPICKPWRTARPQQLSLHAEPLWTDIEDDDNL